MTAIPTLITPQHLLEQSLGSGIELRFVDASWYLPAAERDPVQEFQQRRIPGAVFFDIEQVVDSKASLPHMLPSPEDFAAAMASMGIGRNTWVVAYDTAGIFSSPRLWWMLRVFGHDRVSILDGGMPEWNRAGGPLDTSAMVTPPVKAAAFDPVPPNTALLAAYDQVMAAVECGDPKIVDARAQGRFLGQMPEPRPGLPSGHMPGALNIPFGDVLSEGRLKSVAELDRLFDQHGIGAHSRVITSCGSGITACVLALALHLTGREAAVYDGSWAEWASTASAPIASQSIE